MSRLARIVVPGVRALLDLAESRDADCASVDVLAATHLAEIDRKVADRSRDGVWPSDHFGVWVELANA
jgi:hypothetical protein